MARSKATTRGFLQSINKWAKAEMERSAEVLRDGSKDFYDALAEATPVDTGALRGSLVATVNGAGQSSQMTNVYTAEGNGAAESYANIDAAELGDRISYRYKALYWEYVNYGTSRIAGRFWVEAVGSRYRSIMRAAATRHKMSMK